MKTCSCYRQWKPRIVMTDKPVAVAAERNAEPILEALRREFRHCADVLEIGSGTGQHAAAFAAGLPHLDWQTSDLDENHAAIRAWTASVSNVRAPLSIDVRDAVLPPASYDAVYSSNTAHIMSFEAVVDMMRLVAQTLRSGGLFCLYGPFRKDGAFNTTSNERFNSSLRSRNPQMGLRDLEAIDELAEAGGLRRSSLYAMPSNNLLSVWRKTHE